MPHAIRVEHAHNLGGGDVGMLLRCDSWPFSSNSHTGQSRQRHAHDKYSMRSLSNGSGQGLECNQKHYILQALQPSLIEKFEDSINILEAASFGWWQRGRWRRRRRLLERCALQHVSSSGLSPEPLLTVGKGRSVRALALARTLPSRHSSNSSGRNHCA